MTTFLLITKNFPPQIGGMEKYSFDTYNKLIAQSNKIYLLTASPRNEFLFIRGFSNKFNCFHIQIFWKFLFIGSEFSRLFLFTVKCFLFGPYYGYKSDIVWCLDGSISFIGVAIAKLTKSISRVTVHGKDIVWNNFIYQRIIPKIISMCQEIYVISQNTLNECVLRGLPKDRLILVPHTQESLIFLDTPSFNKVDFLKSLNLLEFTNKKILFSIGRWVERKGFHWFLNFVVAPLLVETPGGISGKSEREEGFIFLLAGFGPMESEYRRIITEKNLKNVTLLGKIDELTKARLFSLSDYFIMPNISIPGDVEGFGLVLLEAQHYGLPCIVSDIDGIGSSIDRKKDILVECLNKDEWLKTLRTVILVSE